MKKTTIKIVAAMLAMLLLVAFMPVSVFAADDDKSSGQSTTSQFLTKVEDEANNDANASKSEQPLAKMGGQIIRIMRIIGVVVAIAMLIYLAIKYISAAPNEKAEIKSSATRYVIGAVILFAASGILGIIEGFASSLN